MTDTATQEIPKHSVHTLVFRSLKRTHDMFLSDYNHPIEIDEKSLDLRKSIKAKDDYGLVLNMPREERPKLVKQVEEERVVEIPQEMGDNIVQEYEPEIEPESAPKAAPIFPSSRPGDSRSDSKALTLFASNQTAIAHRRNTISMPKPQWHAPWKLSRVISGHLGWVRCLDVDPSNEWFVTGGTDRIIKIWDLASGALKLSLTGHVSTVRGVCVSNRHPYLFSCGEDKQVKCWDLECNKVIRHYHGHLSACYALALHPALDILVSAGRDNVARVWDMRTKAQIHSLEGHTNTVATVKCQELDPQIITGSHDSTIRCWDIVAGKTMCTLTNHKKSVRAITLHPKLMSMASASPDNIKEWKLPKAEFIQNLSGHNAVVNALACNSDNVLVSAADNGSMYMWDWMTGYNFQKTQTVAQPGSIDSETGIFAMTFDQSGSRLLTGEADKTIKIYKEDETATEETHPINWKPDLLKRKRF
ncbi:unnamed protein product [Brachionus calyciflorus]|uniref:Pleiotropic regulator 1 n=1 Tax=Brachionus calyciflorus TaxID=104777 RepID=A0A813LX84_9BILA|nr:unnamed protein product [Brachionus calyciflorus]